MTSEAQSAVALRCLIRASVGSPGNAEDIANLNTANLPDGAQCFVTENRVLYRFRKFSTLAASGTVVIAPIAGGGRWVQEGAPSGAVMAFVAGTNTNTTNSSESSDWLPLNSIETALQAGAAGWNFNPGSAILTLTGPGGRYLCTLSATVSPTEGNTVNGIVSLNDDFIAAEAGFEEGEEFMAIGANFDAGQQSVIISAQRLVTLVTGDNLRPKFRYSVAADLDIERLTLSVIPVT